MGELIAREAALKLVLRRRKLPAQRCRRLESLTLSLLRCKALSPARILINRTADFIISTRFSTLLRKTLAAFAVFFGRGNGRFVAAFTCCGEVVFRAELEDALLSSQDRL